MSPTALDRMADDFPHGTIEGERAGCVASDCPAEPLTCAEIGGHYRRDFRFNRLYQSGLRGQELLDAFQPITAPDKTRKTTPKPGPRPRRVERESPTEAEAPAHSEQPEDPAMSEYEFGLNFRTVSQDERDRRLIRAVDAGLSWAQIGREVGSTPGAVSMMHKAALRRAGMNGEKEAAEMPASAGIEAAQAVPVAAPPATDDAPVAAALITERFGVPPVVIPDIPGPQIAQMWVVLDRNKHVLLATTDMRKATAALAAEWTTQIGAES